VEADLRRLQKFYFDRGFLDTTVTLAKVEEDEPAAKVQLEIHIVEGIATRVQDVRLAGTLPPELPGAAKLLTELPLRAGEHISKEAFDKSKELLLKPPGCRICAGADAAYGVDTQLHTATVLFELYPGSRTTFGRFTVKRCPAGARTHHLPEAHRAPGRGLLGAKAHGSTDAIYELGMFLR
jgi:outer membrane protein assembly factor BamA